MPGGARACAAEMVREWERHENFSLYEDALPVLDELRRHGLRIGLVSNGQRDLEEFAAHHGSTSTPSSARRAHGRVKPHASIFVAALRALDAAPDETAMVGDSYEDDIEGARALGIRAILLDRDGLQPDAPDRIDTLLALPAALGLLAATLARRARPPCAAPSGTSAGTSAEPNSAAASLRVATGPTQTSSSPKCSSQSASGARREDRRELDARAPPGPRRTGARRARDGRRARRAGAKNFGSSAPTVRRRPSAVA